MNIWRDKLLLKHFLLYMFQQEPAEKKLFDFTFRGVKGFEGS